MVSPSENMTSGGLNVAKLAKFALILLVFGAWFFVNLHFVSQFSGSEFHADSFRHFSHILKPIMEGSGGLSLLFSNHHATPLLHLHQLVNLNLFGGDLRFDAYFGFIVLCILGAIAGITSFRYFGTKLSPLAATGISALTVTLSLTILSGLPILGH